MIEDSFKTIGIITDDNPKYVRGYSVDTIVDKNIKEDLIEVTIEENVN